MADQPKRNTLDLVKPSYQPTKAELEEESVADVPGKTIEECMANLGRAITEKADARWIDKPGTGGTATMSARRTGRSGA